MDGSDRKLCSIFSLAMNELLVKVSTITGETTRFQHSTLLSSNPPCDLFHLYSGYIISFHSIITGSKHQTAEVLQALLVPNTFWSVPKIFIKRLII